MPTCDGDIEIDVSSSDINEELMKIYDLTGYEYTNSVFRGANISLTASCDIYQKECNEILRVTGTPIWNSEDVDEGRVPKVEYFADCDIEYILHESEVIDTSLQYCFY